MIYVKGGNFGNFKCIEATIKNNQLIGIQKTWYFNFYVHDQVILSKAKNLDFFTDVYYHNKDY